MPSKSLWIDWMLYSYVGSSPLQVTLDWLNALQLCGYKCPPSHTGLVECFTDMCVQVMLDWLNALQLRGFMCPPGHGGLVESFIAMWVQVPSKSCWIGWMFYSYVGSSPLQVTLDWLNTLELCGFKTPPSHAGLVECFTAMWVQILSKSGGLVECFTDTWVQVMLDWLNALKLHGLKSPTSHGGFAEFFTAMWVQVPFKLCWIGWMLYSYVGSSPLQVTLDWLNVLQLCGFKSPPSCAGLVECFTAMWVQVLSQSHWIGWMLYSYFGWSPLQITLDWLNALQLHGFKCPPSHGGLVECFTAMWVQVPSNSCWICWKIYSYVGSSPLKVTLDWLNTLELCGFKIPPCYAGLVECFTDMWVQVFSKSRWIGWMLFRYVGQVMLDWLNALQLCGFKSNPSHTGLVECYTAIWVQVPSKSWWIGWMLYSYVGSRPLQVMLDWLNALQLCGFKCPPSHDGLVECFTATWAQVPSKSWWIGWMLYSYVDWSTLQFVLDWLNALQLCRFRSSPSHAGLVECFTATWVQVPSKSCWIGWMFYSYVGSSPLKVTVDWLNALQLCGFKTPPSHAGLVECFTAMWVQVSSKSWWIGWMLYSYVGSSVLQVMMDWLNALQLHGLKSPPSHGGVVEFFTAMWVEIPFNLCWIGWMVYSYVGSSPL